ncbi:MAG: ABC transporter ATP-binding protein [Acidimicrobiales bacterium]
MAEVELQGLTKIYGVDKVVDRVSMTVADGEFVVILGPSGCGKTTTLRIVAGLEQATSGEVYFDDTSVGNEPPSRRNIGMVFQNYALYPHMTVADNLAFGLQSQRREGSRRDAKASIRRRVEDIAALLEISHVLDHRPKQLSGGSTAPSSSRRPWWRRQATSWALRSRRCAPSSRSQA